MHRLLDLHRVGFAPVSQWPCACTRGSSAFDMSISESASPAAHSRIAVYPLSPFTHADALALVQRAPSSLLSCKDPRRELTRLL